MRASKGAVDGPNEDASILRSEVEPRRSPALEVEDWVD